MIAEATSPPPKRAVKTIFMGSIGSLKSSLSSIIAQTYQLFPITPRSQSIPKKTPVKVAQQPSSSGIINPQQHAQQSLTVSKIQLQKSAQQFIIPLNCMHVSPIAIPRLNTPPATTRTVLNGKSVYLVRWNEIATIGASRTTSSSHMAQAYGYLDSRQIKYMQREKSKSYIISKPKNKLLSVSLSPEYLPNSSKSCLVCTKAPILQRKEEAAAND